MTDYDPSEQDEIIEAFTAMLRMATKDGGSKRAAGTKVPWTIDTGHEAAMFRHLSRWKTEPYGRDEDSGAHHLVAVAWRALAIAYQQTHPKSHRDCCRMAAGVPEPEVARKHAGPASAKETNE